MDALLPVLLRTSPADMMPDPKRLPEYRVLGPYELEGTLAQILTEGGAYYRFDGPADDARRLAPSFVEALAGQDRMDTRAVYTREAWSDWFLCGPWDRTILVLEPESTVWTLLCGADTD